jgi:MoaA/NifB/PqqE/SkfB family radical SAM enzyme
MLNIKMPEGVTSKVLGFASNLSDKNLLRIVNTLGKLTSIEWHDKGVRALQRLIEENHSGIDAAKRAIKMMNPTVRAKLVNNFLLGGILSGYKKRYAFWEKYGVAPPGNLMVSPTIKCNLRCYGCYAGTHQISADLSRAEVEELIVEAGKAGTNIITFLGGEPFTMPWLLDVVEKFPDTGFQIFSNSLLLDDEKIARLAQAGNAIIVIGLDGPKEFTDGRKGEGAFEGALANMKKLSNAGVLVGYSTMVSRKNFDHIYADEFIDTMIDHGAAFGWCAIAIPQGKACKDLQLVPTPEQKAMISEKVRNVRARKPLIIIDFYSDANITEGCGAGRVTIHVNNNGDVEPCVFFPFSVDNIRQKPFLDILKSDFFKSIRKIPKDYAGNVQTCMMAAQPKAVLKIIEDHNARETSAGTLEQLHALAEKQQ